MSQAFSTPGGSLGEVVGPAIMLFVIFPEGARPGWRLSTEIRTTQTMTIHLGR